MEETYWNKFMMTGSVDDYLSYKGMEICSSVMQRYEDVDSIRTGDTEIESGYSYGDGNLRCTDR